MSDCTLLAIINTDLPGVPDESKYLEPWTIKQLYDMLQENLLQCRTQLETDCCESIAGKEIREKAQEWAKVRRLSPGEIATASQFGYQQ